MQQSVRHHLSLSRLFERQDRPASAPGHGSYWTVNLDAPPGTKRPRKRGRSKKDGDDAESSAKRCRSKEEMGEKGPIPSATGVEAGHIAVTSTPNQPPAHRHESMDPSCSPPPLLAMINDRYRSQAQLAVWDPAPLRPLPNGSFPKEEDELRPNPFNPRSPSPFPSPSGPSPSATSCSTAQEFERLIEENRELKKEAVSVFNRLARMASDLSDAHAEIARLRARNETLERESDGWPYTGTGS